MYIIYEFICICMLIYKIICIYFYIYINYEYIYIYKLCIYFYIYKLSIYISQATCFVFVVLSPDPFLRKINAQRK